VKWVCHSIAAGSYLIPLKVTSYEIWTLKTIESDALDSTPNNKIGLNAHYAWFKADVSLAPSSVKPAAILGIIEVATN